jgi:pimeloyl-ACP methyl ester carboxylesterase
MLHAVNMNAQPQTFGGTRINFLVDGHPGFVVEPARPESGGRKPWIWYAPAIGNYPNKSNAWIFEQLVRKGFRICGMDVGESFGNPVGSRLFSKFYDTLMIRFHLDPKACLFAQSRGGLMLYNWAAEPGNSTKVSRIAAIYPVCNLLSYPGPEKAASAYGMSRDDFELHLKEYNPIDKLRPLYEAGIRIFHIHGDSDAVVPLAENSRIIYERYKEMGGDIRLIVIPGKGHEEIPEYFQSEDLLNFLLEETAAEVKPPAKNRKPDP